MNKNPNENNELVPSGEPVGSAPQLFTIAELAKQFNLSNDAMRVRIRKLKLEPEVPEKLTGSGAIAAKYNLETYQSLKQQQQVLEEKQVRAAKVIHAGMKDVGKRAFVDATYQELSLDEKVEFMMSAILVTLAEMKKGKEKAEAELVEAHNEHAELTDAVQVLSIQVDLSSDYYPVTRTNSGSLNRKEHAELYRTALELGFTDGELKWGEWTQEDFDTSKKYSRIQVKGSSDKYPAWAYHYKVWETRGFVKNAPDAIVLTKTPEYAFLKPSS